MANPFAGQTDGIRAGQAGAEGSIDPDQYRISILKRYKFHLKQYLTCLNHNQTFPLFVYHRHILRDHTKYDLQ